MVSLADAFEFPALEIGCSPVCNMAMETGLGVGVGIKQLTLALLCGIPLSICPHLHPEQLKNQKGREGTESKVPLSSPQHKEKTE